MISPPQRMKSGGETLFAGAGENSALFSTTVPREGADVVICGGSPTNLSARGHLSLIHISWNPISSGVTGNRGRFGGSSGLKRAHWCPMTR